MNVRIHSLAIVVLSLLAMVIVSSVGVAVAPPQRRESADLVIVGMVHDLTFTRSVFGDDGSCIRWYAEVVVTDVERGKGALIGEKLNIRWIEIVKKPSKPLPGAREYRFRMKADDVVRFWLIRQGKDWTIIDNPDGVQNLTETR